MHDLYKDDHFSKRFATDDMINAAKDILNEAEQTEEAFLGAQAVLLLNGLL